jgi:hypothetical protein
MGGSEWLCGGLEREMLWDQVLRGSCRLPNAEGATEEKERKSSVKTAQAHILLGICFGLPWGTAIHHSSRQSGIAEHQQHMEYECGTF